MLPATVQNAVFDHLRLGVVKGRGAAALRSLGARLDRRSRAIFVQWLENLTDEEDSAIMSYLDGGRA
jgi:hypothetical protein